MGTSSAYSLTSTAPTPTLASLGSFAMTSASAVQDDITADVRQMWAAAGGPAQDAVTRTLGAAEEATRLAVSARSAGGPGPGYGTSGFGCSLAEVAAVLKGGVTPEVVCVDSYGWDTHTGMNQGGGRIIPWVLADFAASLDAFVTDLGPDLMSRTTVVAMTEFGRTADENSSGGTDHGFGSTMIALGAGVQGGRVHGPHPGLATSDLEGGALAIGTDYRDPLAELVTHRLGNAAHLDTVFPGHTPRPLGVFAAA